MEKIPMEWVDRIFELMMEFFQDRWENQFKNYDNQINAYKAQWRNGLIGLSKDEIKVGLKISKRMAIQDQKPPHVLDFYYYSKGTKQPPPPFNKDLLAINSKLAKNALEQLKTITR